VHVRLPVEILYEIFSRLGDRSRLLAFFDSNACQYRNYTHLLNVSNVNHTWHSAAVIIMYEEVVLDYDSSVLNFARTLEARPEYGVLVRRLSLPGEMRKIAQEPTAQVHLLRDAVERILEGCCETTDVALPLSDVNVGPGASYQRVVKVTSVTDIVGSDRALKSVESRVRKLTLYGSSPTPQKLALALPIASSTSLSRALSRLTSLSLTSVFLHQPDDHVFDLFESDEASEGARSKVHTPALRALRHLHITYGLARGPPLADILRNAPALESVEIGCTRLVAPFQWNIADSLRPYCAGNLKYLRVFRMHAFSQFVDVGILSGFTALRSLTLDHDMLAAAVSLQQPADAARLEPPPGLEELVVLLSPHNHNSGPSSIRAFNLLSTIKILLRTWYRASLTPRLSSVEIWSEINANSLPWEKWMLSSFLLREHFTRVAPDIKIDIFLQYVCSLPLGAVYSCAHAEESTSLNDPVRSRRRRGLSKRLCHSHADAGVHCGISSCDILL